MFKITFMLFMSFLSCTGPNGHETGEPPRDYAQFHSKALQFCKDSEFSQDYYFLIDLSVHSGKNRFFIYDFKSKKVSASNLVTHGSCNVFENNETKNEIAKFSNRDNSHCSSFGKYKVQGRDYSSWGIKVKYWLEGMEPTNSNAKKRVVVLHSWSAVANAEIYPKYSPLSWGCPAVSDNFMRVLDAKLQETGKPVLLWIID
ncbi:MAG: peptidase [Flavobacterium sp.]|nr:MAG: peptidase [Flavobacterium sp.]